VCIPTRPAPGLALRNLVFTVVVPGAGGVYVPWLILARNAESPRLAAWYGLVVITAGVLLYASCLWVFGAVGRGTPGPWDPPRRLVVVGPYRWVRNPIYLAALLVILGEAWSFLSPPLLLYAAGVAAGFHLFVVGYEEPRLRRAFGTGYAEYVRAVPRWIPRRPGAA
jgi:protein-S-isoprenylcysteine O-methyltransferase Ste14